MISNHNDSLPRLPNHIFPQVFPVGLYKTAIPAKIGDLDIKTTYELS